MSSFLRLFYKLAVVLFFVFCSVNTFGQPDPCNCDPADLDYNACIAACGEDGGGGTPPDPCPCDPGDPAFLQCIMDNPECEDSTIPVTRHIWVLITAMIILVVWKINGKQVNSFSKNEKELKIEEGHPA